MCQSLVTWQIWQLLIDDCDIAAFCLQPARIVGKICIDIVWIYSRGMAFQAGAARIPMRFVLPQFSMELLVSSKFCNDKAFPIGTKFLSK